MKPFFKSLYKISAMLIFMISCASSQKLQEEAPVTITEPYFQKWMAGVKEGGSGLDIYIPVAENNEVVLTDAYFKGKKIPLSFNSEENVYEGHYKYPKNTKKGMVMSSDPKEEYGNPVPVLEAKIPFDLKGNECVIAYTKDNKQSYFKLDTLQEKETLAYPSAPED